MLQRDNNLFIELPLFVFAHMFNRLWVITPMLLTWMIGYYRYDIMLSSQGFVTLGTNIEEIVKLRMGFCLMFFLQLVLLAMVTSTQIMKSAFKRERP